MNKKKLTLKKNSRLAPSKKKAVVRAPIKLPQKLTPAETYKECPLGKLPKMITATNKRQFEIISQERAVQAINMGLGIEKPGYNIYVAGHEGTGKTSVIRSFLEKWSIKKPAPSDWIYVYDFEKPETPKAISLPAGRAKKFKKQMTHLVRDIHTEIRRVLQSEEYESSINTYLSSSNERKAKLFSELEKLAKTHGFIIKSTKAGIETIPLHREKLISEKEYQKLDEETRTDIERRRTALEPEVLDFVRKVRAIEYETKDYIDTLRSDFLRSAMDSVMQEMIREYTESKCQDIVTQLELMKEDILETYVEYIEYEEDREEGESAQELEDPSRKYQVNIFVDNSKSKGAPIIIETNPTFYNLFGKIEKNVEHGIYHTDFTMIKPGSLQKANGGYIVIAANDIFRNPGIWETLKRVLRSQQAFIEDFGEQMALFPTSGLRPQPIPLNLKVILVGSDEIYHLLYEEDEDFQKIFKIKADFDYKMERDATNVSAYVDFIASRVQIDQLLPFDRSAMGMVVEFASRLVEDQRLMSTKFGAIKDLAIEADYMARESEDTVVKREHIVKALDLKYFRLNLYEQALLDMVRNRDILLSVDGAVIGQINGLTVYDLGDYSFGKICRITCTASVSDDGINNIERSSRLSGKTHDKGMYIITGFLNAVLARETNLGVSATVCFEQSYGLIDGDSASAAELIAILSSMSEIKIDQSFAMTGSINQMGEIQAVGGINEKIEGFYKSVRLIGKNKSYNLIMPASNQANLMLHDEVRAAVKDGFLNIYPVRYLWEAFELVTGVPLGITSVHDKEFSAGSCLEKIRIKLDHLQKQEQHHTHKHSTHDGDQKENKAAKGKKG